jgi:O-acetyl-ADP-ribose deacetylase (regulator of RNase III)
LPEQPDAPAIVLYKPNNQTTRAINSQGERRMADTINIGKSTFRLVMGDVTDLEIDAFVYCARHDLALGSGYGTAISVRGGPSIQEELKQLGSIKTTEAVVSSAGEMKANFIIHAVGPMFQEEDTESKLKATVLNALKKADEKNISQVAFPAMCCGFYGVPLDTSARVTIETIAAYLEGETGIKEVVICLLDSREYKPFQARFAALGQTVKEAS